MSRFSGAFVAGLGEQPGGVVVQHRQGVPGKELQQDRRHVRVAQDRPAEVHGLLDEPVHPAGRVAFLRERGLADHQAGDLGHDVGPVGEVVIERRRPDAELAGEAGRAARREPFGVDDPQRRGDHGFAGQQGRRRARHGSEYALTAEGFQAAGEAALLYFRRSGALDDKTYSDKVYVARTKDAAACIAM
jgi:hypothetical protein